jgi:2,4-dienoyl-CoA reductase-like NADH-dependent reductase (Old Yellow Enzyme family)
MVTGLAAEDGFVTDLITQRYQREARGGVGSIVIEGTTIHPQKSPFSLRISDDIFIPGLRKMVEAVHEARRDVKIGIQIMHWLKLAHTGWRQKVEDLKPEEVAAIREQFVAAARRAQTAGFDFIEIHMAHCYTLGAFLSLTNRRTDEYGGSFENRIRLPMEVHQGIRRVVGANYPLGMRMNGEDFIIQGNTLLHSTRIARRFAELGIDYISVSAGDKFEDALEPPPGKLIDNTSGYSGHRMSPCWWAPDGANVYLAEGIRESLREGGFDTPVIAAGKIRTPQFAERLLERSKADIIGLCRTLLCDPDWPNKAQQGREKEIVRCAACNYCLEIDWKEGKPRCSRWPEDTLIAPEPFLPGKARPAKLPKEAN